MTAMQGTVVKIASAVWPGRMLWGRGGLHGHVRRPRTCVPCDGCKSETHTYTCALHCYSAAGETKQHPWSRINSSVVCLVVCGSWSLLVSLDEGHPPANGTRRRAERYAPGSGAVVWRPRTRAQLWSPEGGQVQALFYLHPMLLLRTVTCKALGRHVSGPVVCAVGHCPPGLKPMYSCLA